jgi:hypothetical protein
MVCLGVLIGIGVHVVLSQPEARRRSTGNPKAQGTGSAPLDGTHQGRASRHLTGRAATRVRRRVAKTAYGPLNPPRRPSDGNDPAGWGRFDTTNGRTVYGAATRECAYAEVLSYTRRRLGQTDPLAAAAEGLAAVDGATALAEIVDQEWAERGHLPLGHLPRGWREERAIYRLELPSEGWWVLLESPESIAAIERALPGQLAACGVADLDVAVLRGANRAATVLMAARVRGLILDDASRPHGIRFSSRHATGDCWAFWLRHVDAGSTAASEPPAAGRRQPPHRRRR